MVKNCYVDNLCQGALSVSEATDKAILANEAMQQAGMKLCQWTTNSDELNQNLQSLGFFAPIVVQGKLCIQQLWDLKCGWDDHINDPKILQSISKLFKEIAILESFPIPRCPFMGQGCEKSIHVFCDSSNVASAVCIYLVERSNSKSASNLMLSKTKVVPIKFPEGREEDLRIPRKELVACLMGAKLGVRVSNALSLPQSILRFWTDSTICLSWIRSPKEKLPVYIKNRVNKIRSLTTVTSWDHVPSDQNPADIPSRGQISVQNLMESSLWKHGPSWIESNSEYWPSFKGTSEVQAFLANVIPSNEESEEFKPIIQLHRFSSLFRAQRVAAWTLRALKNRIPVAKMENHPYLSAIPEKTFSKESPIPQSELANALNFLIMQEQKYHFPEEFQSLSQGHSFPKSSSLAALRPTWDSNRSIIVSIGREKPKVPLILLPKRSDLSRLILHEFHIKSFHGGTEITLGRSRDQYWIINGRVMAKQIIRSCPVCKVFSASPYLQLESALPLVRSTPAPPFHCAGCDFAGPFYLRNDMKVSILLFTCGVTRSVHLEVVPDLSSESFLNAFRRFQARRSIPRIMFSDNAPTFKRASRLLPAIEWRFIPEKSPWWGGFYERLVKSVKMALKKVVGKSQIAFPLFQTLIIEIEDMINSRPLTIVSDDVDNPHPLTPNHFLKPAPDVGDLKLELQGADDLKRMWNNRNRLLQHFWKRWKSEYLSSLRLWRQRRVTGTIVPAVGDVVLIETEGRSRNLWPLGIIHSVIKGTDGHARAAIVRVTRVDPNKDGLPVLVSFLRRPTRQLYPLESSLLGDSGGDITRQYVMQRSSKIQTNPGQRSSVEGPSSKVVSKDSKNSPPLNVTTPGCASSRIVKRSSRLVRPPGYLQDFKI
jgi:hypothetical protein